MKRLLFVVFAVLILGVGCSKKSEESSQSTISTTATQSENSATETQSKEDAEKKKLIKGMYDFAIGLVKAEAQKNNVLVDAFELRNAKELYVSPAQLMNGWKNFVWFQFRFAVKGAQDSEWVDIPTITFYNQETNESAYSADYSFVIGLHNGENKLVKSEPGVDEMATYFEEKGKGAE